MLTELIDQHALIIHGLVALAGLVIYAFASNAWRQRRHPSAAIAWIVSLTLVPYIALPLYLLIGNRKVVRATGQRPAVRPPPSPGYDDGVAGPMCHLAAAMGLPTAATYHDLQIDPDGAAALGRVHAIMRAAQARLDICTFLIGRDIVGKTLCDLMIERVRAGVRVRLLVDSIGLYLGGHPNMGRLEEAGVEVCLFVRPWSSPLPGRTNLRNHRKMIIADGAVLWTGGRNLAAEYFTGGWGPTRNKPAWVDLSFSLHGDLVQAAQAQFDRDWQFASGAPHPTPESTVPAAIAEPGTVPSGPRAQLIPSGPDQSDDTLHALLVSNCFTARRRILAITPYFVPDATLQMALTLAALRGVAVDLVLPAHSNHLLADFARHAALRELAQAGGRIWLVPTMTHAKAIVFDDQVAITGSANLDERSLFLNFELAVGFFAPAHIAAFATWIERQQAMAKPLHPRTPGMARAALEGLVRWLAFQI